jgi:non-ribosomal peptide synthase protein (TIGR01720 family)
MAGTIDLSRTVGWFTSIAPVSLTIDASADFADSVERVQAALAGRPHRGIGFGALRYLSPDPRTRERLAAMPPRGLSFNYLGQFAGTAGGPVRVAPESPGPMRDPAGERRHLIEVDAVVRAGRLAFSWHYSRQLYQPDTITAVATGVAQELRSAVRSRAPVPGRDRFPAASVDAAELASVIARIEREAD